MGCQFPRAQEKQEVKSESEIDLQKHVVLGSFVFFLTYFNKVVEEYLSDFVG